MALSKRPKNLGSGKATQAIDNLTKALMSGKAAAQSSSKQPIVNTKETGKVREQTKAVQQSTQAIEKQTAMVRYFSREVLNAAKYLNDLGVGEIDIGIILGTGLGKLSEQIEDPIIVPYKNIPNFPLSTVEFHAGEIFYGRLFGKKVLAFKGRFHLYEGYNFLEITFPIRLLDALGTKTVIISNAAGAINLKFQKGSLMIINDHINLQGSSPLAVKGIEKLGERFVDMSNPYSASLIEKSLTVAKNLGITLFQGVYVAVVGPQLETAAEYRFLRIIGSDAVGMSTVPEVIVARQLKMEVLAFSVITDMCNPDNLEPININDILATAKIGEEKLSVILAELFRLI